MTLELIFKHVHYLSRHIANLFSELHRVLLRASQLNQKAEWKKQDTVFPCLKVHQVTFWLCFTYRLLEFYTDT